MKKIVYIEKDELNAIAICRDHFNGVVVQVVRFVDQMVPTGTDQTLTNVRNNQVVHQVVVKIADGDDFRGRVGKGISQAKEYLANIRKQDKEIDGILNDYCSQFRGLNEEETNS